MKDVHVLSLGAGTQSSCMALMSAYGDLPRPDYIIFSDTGWEPKFVYEWLEKLKSKLAEFGLKVITVSNGNIYKNTLRSIETGERTPSLPYYTKNPITGTKGMVMRQCTQDYKILPKIIKYYRSIEKFVSCWAMDHMKKLKKLCMSGKALRSMKLLE